MRNYHALLFILITTLSILFLPACNGAGRSTTTAQSTDALPGGNIATAQPSAQPTLSPDLFDGNGAYQHVLAQVDFGARPAGSAALQRTGDYILEQLKSFGWHVEEQEFAAHGIVGRNIIAKRGSGSVVIIGAHYDTRLYADQDPDESKRTEPVLGANDGASGAAVLLELARTLNSDKIKHEVWLSFFDAEDNGDIGDWEWGIGSTFMANHLIIQPEAMILLDMIGDSDQQIKWEQNSSPVLNKNIWDVAATLGYSESFQAQPGWTMIDDHLAFIQRGIPAVDLIDFDYPYWHTTSDTADKVSAQSLERVGRTIAAWLEQLP